MADRKRKMTTGAKYVAVGALTESIEQVQDDEFDGSEYAPAEKLARGIVERAWDVEFFPNAGRVTITLDVNQLVNGPGPADRAAREADDQIELSRTR